MDEPHISGIAQDIPSSPEIGQPLPPTRLPGGPSRYAFFLDIDGTLIRLAVAPGRAYVDPWLLEILRVLNEAAEGAVALISGRTVDSIDRLFAPLSFAAAGQHGAERRTAAGSVQFHAPGAAQIEAARRCVAAWVSGMEGVMLEDKGICVAVHYRQAPQREAEARAAVERCRERTGDAYEIQSGKMVFELRPAGINKGTAIRQFMAEAPFAGRVPLFLGDDATDEHGFAAVNGMAGRAIKVGEGETLAGWRLPDVAAVRAWLAAILGRASPDAGWSSGQQQA
jgi:trehalose 6-phosphate phosphatase